MNSVIGDLSSYSFKDIKNAVNEFIYSNDIMDDSYEELTNSLLKDKRKNVFTLGSKLKRDKEKYIQEIERVSKMYAFDKSFGYDIVCGVDEVGRGPLAGPIVACAVILDNDGEIENLILGLNDSKKISEKKREELAEIIKEKALAYEIAFATNHEIDTKGIAFCNNKVFLDACNNLKIKPELVLSDGYLVKNIKLANNSVIKGDTKSASIAAASIVAKVYRDNLMKEYHKEYPGYGFDENAGYGTPKHIEGLRENGVTQIHRRSFLKNLNLD